MAGDTHANITTTMSNQARSIASTFPFELVEKVVLQLPLSDILMAAANVPIFWREVIENSQEVWTRIERDSNTVEQVYRPPHRRCRAREALPSGAETAWHFKCELVNGTLYVHRRKDGNEAFVFAPFSGPSPLRVLNPVTKAARFVVGPSFAFGYIMLYDFEGKLVCGKPVSQNRKGDRMRNFLVACYAVEGKREEAGANKGKVEGDGNKGRLVLPLSHDGDSEVMARS